MEKQLFVHYDQKERVLMLKDNCDKVDTMTYSKHLNEDEMRKEEQDFSELAIKISTIEEELAAKKAEYAAKLKPLKTDYKSSLYAIQTKQKLVTEEVYCIVDYENLEIGIYNHRGELVKERKLTEEEKQLKLEFVSVNTLFPELNELMKNSPVASPELPQETISDEMEQDTAPEEIVPPDNDLTDPVLDDDDVVDPTVDPTDDDY